MSIICLTEQERDRFASWLEQEAASDAMMAEQTEKLGPMGAAVVKLLRTKAAVKTFIAKDLRGVEEMTITSVEEGAS